MSAEMSPEEFATAIRDSLAALNQLLYSAAGKNLRVDLEVKTMPVVECPTPRTFVQCNGVFLKVEPTPRPAPEPPPRRSQRRA